MDCIRKTLSVVRVFAAVLLVLPCFLYSQKQGNVWYFGNRAGLSFNGGSVATLSGGQTSSDIVGTLFMQEGTSSICDSTGTLLFYTGGKTAWNRLHQPMPNGLGLMGGTSSTQSSLIVPKPGSDSLFYVFTSDEYQNFPKSKGYRYSVVDICLDNGKGDVISNFKNILLADSSTEKLAACRDAAGTGYWVIGHKMFSNQFIAWHLTSAGITATVTSKLGTLHGWLPKTSAWFAGNAAGQMKLNPAGTKLAVAVGHNLTSILDLFDFNNTNGVVSSFCHMRLDSILQKSIYGIEFSPDGSKLYTTLSIGSGPNKICQLDMNAGGGSCSAIENSSLSILQASGNTFEGMQLAPDGKIYFAGGGPANVGCIHAPDLAGLACSAVLNTFSLSSPALNYFTFPSFVAGYAYHNAVQSCCAPMSLSISSTKDPLCVGESTTLTASGGISYTWNPSGTIGSSLVVSPNATSHYTVSSEDQKKCKTSITRTLGVNALPSLTVTGKTTICSDAKALQTVLGAKTYTWSNGLTGNPVSLTPSVTTTYTVYGSNAAGCSNQQTVTIQVNPSPTIATAGSTILCAGSAVSHTASGAQSYTWATGAQGSTVSLAPTVSSGYTVEGVATNGCRSAAYVFIFVKPAPLLSVTNLTACEGLPVTLVASTNFGTDLTYTWSPGTLHGAAITITPTASMSYSVVADYNGCLIHKTASVSVTPVVPAVTGFSYAPACEKSVVTAPVKVKGFNEGGVFSSENPELDIDPGSGDIDLSALKAGTYLVKYSAAPGGCTVAASHTRSLTVLASPSLTISKNTVIEEGETTLLTASGSDNYSWFPSSYLSCADCHAPLASPPESMEFCVTSFLNSCASKTCVTVSIIDCETASEFSLPNAFTPNGDGTNDEFCLQGWDNCISDFKILVFNRWGEKVFESQKTDFCWDGTFNGKPLATETFIYALEARKKKTSVHRKGNITLLR